MSSDDFAGGIYHHLFQGNVFFVRFLRETFPYSFHNAALDGGGNVYLADAIVDAGLEVCLAGAAAAMQDKGKAVASFVYLDETLNVQLRCMNIVPMQVADSDGKGIDACAAHEADCLIHIGEHIRSIDA